MKRGLRWRQRKRPSFVGNISHEAWRELTHDEEALLLIIGDYEDGRYEAAELRRRLALHRAGTSLVEAS